MIDFSNFDLPKIIIPVVDSKLYELRYKVNKHIKKRWGRRTCKF